ncbi:STAS domain-containing protein [Yinghuangia sp. KLBMP8922]|uniref:STAS domain-containing protein n=1 Tax=Yinghuangia soli TaxID=2908204 RepID=A0AA41TZD9_9ACTN|nr:STAS domain-containing protein [Yinghuangia soli]
MAGEIDQDSVPALRDVLEAVLDTGCLGLHVDLTAVRFIDSSGLHVLLASRDRLHERGGVLTVAPSPQTVSLLEVTQTRGLFPPAPSPSSDQPNEAS